MSDVMHALKISSQKNAAGNFDIAWQMQHWYAANTSATWTNWKVPNIMHQDNNDRSKMYIMGRFYGKAAVV